MLKDYAIFLKDNKGLSNWIKFEWANKMKVPDT